MIFHTLGTYQDGFSRVEYCVKCGAEGLELLSECPSKPAESPDCGHSELDANSAKADIDKLDKSE